MLLGSFSGCATIYGTKQTVLVKSDHSGDQIYDRGNFVGSTPGFVKVRRRFRPQLTLQHQDESPQSIPLQTRYRWGRSFAGNLIFFQAAPIGWLVDILTGAAWEVEDPKIETNQQQRLRLRQIVAIAPLDGVDHDISAALAPELEYRLQQGFDGSVLSYLKTEPVFRFYSDESPLPKKRDDKYNLFYELKATDIFVGKAEPTPDGYRVTGKIVNVHSGDSKGDWDWTFRVSTPGERERLVYNRKVKDYFKILPDTVFLSFAKDRPVATIADKQISGRYVSHYGFGNEVINYMSLISISAMDRPIAGMRSHWVLNFVPALAASRRRIQFNSYEPLEDTEFTRTYLNAGYGIEVGYSFKYGYPYLDIIPGVTWTQLSYKNPDDHGTIRNSHISLLVELGYSYFFTKHWVAKFYSRSFGEDSEAWLQAIERSGGAQANIDAVSSISTGIAIGYYIPSTYEASKKWRVEPRKPTKDKIR